MFVIKVYVTNSSLFVNRLYSYYYEEDIEPFKRVEVIFNRSKTSALVIESFYIDNLKEYEEKEGYKLSKIINVIDEKAIINNEQYELAKWLSKTTISPFISCLNTMLPKPLRTSKVLSSSVKKEYLKKINYDYPFTKRQKEVFDSLYDDMLLSEARKISSSIIKTFIENGVIEINIKDKEYSGDLFCIKDNFKTLTIDQEKAYNDFISSDKLVSLLYGVTGSGKTEVYLHLARYYLRQNKEVLILVPEISLTPQMIQRVKERFNEVIFYHSELNDQERYEQYMRVKEGKVKIVVSTRSGIFLPFHDLGLIIIDEEHDTSYKQDNMPCYSVKNVAIKRALYFKAKILMASATPSLDSYTRAKKGDYGFLRLDKRINNTLPSIEIVDLNKEHKNKNSSIISSTFYTKIDKTLNNHKQAIILLNRRGYSPIVRCSKCNGILMCDNCDIPLNYHKDINLLMCHQCGKTYKPVSKCPSCGSDVLVFYGYGTLKVEEEIKRLFPLANVERMDRDNVSKKGAHEKILKRFENKEIDILIGTQMIAKGLDYPDVTLVGILNADSGLMHQDYNAAKITFDLLMQASGRSGRANELGEVVIEAYNVDHYVLKAVLRQDYDYFYNIEMNYRLKTSYPPYKHLLMLMIYDSNVTHLENSLNYFEKVLNDVPFKYYRPLELNKLNGNKRYRILFLNKDIKELIEFTWNIVDDYLKQKNMAKIKVDIDPLYLE